MVAKNRDREISESSKEEREVSQLEQQTFCSQEIPDGFFPKVPEGLRDVDFQA